jgi:hypothetical protein
MLRARTAAERWSAPTTAGSPAHEVLTDRDGIARLLASREDGDRLVTRVSPEFLAWRYASEPIDYRALVARDGLDAGLVLFRVRRRGGARELAVCDVIVAGDDAGLRRDLLRRLARVADADYLIAGESSTAARTGFVRVPRLGPILTSRVPPDQGVPPPLGEWGLRLGDIELF